MYYGYVHCTADGTPFYVGAGGYARTRLFSRRRDCPPYEAIALNIGKDNIFVGTLECSSKEIAFELEQGLIKCLRRQGVDLCNRTDGGAGITGSRPEHSKVMSERGYWLGDNNPWFGTGERQAGAKNHMARQVRGIHPEYGERTWDTLKDASETIGVSIQAISQAIRKRQRSKGWKMEHANGSD
jgi:hypothetical protein